MSIRINLVGETFTRLKVIEELPQRNNKRYFKCECICGIVKTVEYSKLKYGSTKSCGCLNKELRESRYLDLTDQVFGRLTARQRDGERRANGSVVWACECECTKVTYVSSGDLISGNTTSCGCLVEKLTGELQSKNEENYYVDGVFVSKLKQKVPTNSSTGVKGVSVHVGKNGKLQYMANITVKGKRHYLGLHDTIELATAARVKAEEKYHQPYIDKLEEKNNVE